MSLLLSSEKIQRAATKVSFLFSDLSRGIKPLKVRVLEGAYVSLSEEDMARIVRARDECFRSNPRRVEGAFDIKNVEHIVNEDGEAITHVKGKPMTVSTWDRVQANLEKGRHPFKKKMREPSSLESITPPYR